MPRLSTPSKRVLCIAAGLWAAATALTAAASPECRSAAAGIPATAPGAVSGREFAARVASLEGAARDEEVRTELFAGDLPQHLRHFAPVRMHGFTAAGEPVDITLCVMPDYLAVGSDQDALLVPMGLPTALLVAARYGFVLPTPRMVDAIYDAAAVKLAPEPLPAGDHMRSTAYVVRHDRMIAAQRAARQAPADALTAGHKKDIVATARLARAPGRVAIYGWHRASHQPIQPLSTVHGEGYADYSHGVRLVSRTVYVNDAARSIDEVLADPQLGRLLAD
jgi:hypothetical protein